MWTAIAITCRHGHDYLAIEKELRILQEKGVFPHEIPLIVVEDPSKDIGSGGSTLNALLVISEHISAKANQTVLSVDVLQDAFILIIHLGDNFTYDPCGRAFYPLGGSILTESDILVPLNPLIHLYTTVTQKLRPSIRSPGVWVLGSDAFFTLKSTDAIAVDESVQNADLVAFTSPVNPNFAGGHGVYKLDDKSYVENIVYKGSESEIYDCCLSGGKEVPLVLALLFISVPVAESLLLLHSEFPLSCSTYIGIDSGGIGLKLSLFFDFLLPTCKKFHEENFIGGDRAGSMGKPYSNSKCEQRSEQVQLMPMARKSLWEALHKYQTKAVIMETEHYHYLSNNPDEMKPFTNFIKQSFSRDALYQSNCSNGDFLEESCCMAEAFELKRDQMLEIYWKIVERVLKNNENICILPILRSVCIDGRVKGLLNPLDILASLCESTQIIGRTFSCIADILGILAKGEGGLRSGPAANKQWKLAISFLEMDHIEKGARALAEAREKWMSSPSLLIRAARHYEAAAQIFIRKTVMGVQKYIDVKRDVGYLSDERWVKCEAAVRMDIAGGWSDTPPITYEHGGAVLNAAIKVDGMKPVGARCRITQFPDIRVCFGSNEWRRNLVLTTLEDLKCYNSPANPGSLICSVILCSKLVELNSEKALHEQLAGHLGVENMGLEIECWSNLPQGSGLGTSSILAGCLLMAVWRATGHSVDIDSLLHAILYVEQLLTTGGGWQDQVGGLVPGLKIGRFDRNARLAYETVSLTEDQRKGLEDRLLLVYTGRTRLAKNLLQEVIRNWYSRQRDIVETVHDLVANAELGKIAAGNFDLELLGHCAKEYWKQKKRMAPGCEPLSVAKLLDALYTRDLIHAGWLAGAGGGGYLYILTKEPNMAKQVADIINEIVPGKGMTLHSVQIDMEPLIITLS